MKIKVVHLLSEPQSDREIRSRASVSPLGQHGFEYIPIINPRWTGETPPRVGMDSDDHYTPGRYGCWKAHRDAITEHLVDVDALLVCEADCIFVEPIYKIASRIEDAYQSCLKGNLTAFTLGYRHAGKTIDRVNDRVIVIDQWIGTECYLVPIASRPVFDDLFSKQWDAYDLLLTHHLLDQQKRRIGTFADRPVAVQGNGQSLITGGINTHESHFRNVRYKQ